MAGAAPAPVAGARGHVPALDGLRACAIALVLLYHLTPGHDSDRGLAALGFKLADVGWGGVDVFFVLSGFLVTRIALDDRAHGRRLGAFVRNRLLRIVPACYLALAIVFVAVPLLGGPYPVPGAGVQWPYWLYVANFRFGAPEPLALFGLDHLWSLSLEMQFYLLWPLALYRLPLPALRRAALALLGAGIAARAVLAVLGADPAVTFAWTPLRLDGLLLGALAAMGVRRAPPGARALRVAWLVLAAAAAAIATAAWFGHGGAVFKPAGGAATIAWRVGLPAAWAAFAAALLVLALRPGAVARVLSAPLLRPLARYSYGLYVAHYLLVPLFEAHLHPRRLAAWTGDADLAVWAYFAIASTLSLAVAIASYHLVEVHFLRRKSRP